MENILNKIKLEDFKKNEVDIKDLVKSYKERLIESKILKKESKTKKSNGTFESNIWILYAENRDLYCSIDFNEIYDLVKLKKITKKDYELLKCWCAERILDTDEPTSPIVFINLLLPIFKKTNGFKPKSVKTEYGNVVLTYIDTIETDSPKINTINGLKSYIEFLYNLGIAEKIHNSIMNDICKISINSTNPGVRKLPRNEHIFKFNYLINKFFEEEEDILLKKIYYPLLIWWKLTTVIPIRPSELSTKTYRDCLIEEDGKYFLKLNRIKVKSHKARIPILSKIELNKETYKLIKKYILFTNFTTSKTLFSYNAMMEFKKKYIKLHDKTNDDIPVFQPQTLRFNKESFNKDTLDSLLDNFYTYILANRYDYTCKEEDKLDLGDTRHLAFTSLYLQGLSPIEVAMLGGHTTLHMQENYFGHVQYYIEDETLNYLSDKTIWEHDLKLIKNLKSIILSKKWGYELDVKLSNFDKTDDGIGYCLLDTNIVNKTLCEDVIHCAFCSKWWCEPTNENYMAVRDYLLKTQVSTLEKEIQYEAKLFKNILKESKLVNVNGLIEIDKFDDEKRKSQAIKLKAKADKLVELKLALINNQHNKLTK